MTDWAFDRMLRQRAQAEAFAMPETYDAKLERALSRCPARPNHRRAARALAIAVLLMLLLGSALAVANRYGVLEYLGRTGDALLQESVQDVHASIQDERVDISITQALCDGKQLRLAWMMDNKNPETPLYVVPDQVTVNGQKLTSKDLPRPQGGMVPRPGQDSIQTFGLTVPLSMLQPAESWHVVVIYLMYSLTGEVRQMAQTPADLARETADASEERLRQIDTAILHNTVTVDAEGQLVHGLSNKAWSELEFSRYLVDLKLMELLGGYAMSFHIEETPVAANAVHAKPQTLPMDTGLLRVTQMQFSALGTLIELEQVYTDQRPSSIREVPEYGFLDETGATIPHDSLMADWKSSFLSTEEGWTVRYRYWLPPFAEIPETIRLVLYLLQQGEGDSDMRAEREALIVPVVLENESD